MLMTRIAKASDEEEQVESSPGAVCSRVDPASPAQMWQGLTQSRRRWGREATPGDCRSASSLR
jgi:hypothetical protein